jgi:hypothetical protein
MDVDAMSRWLAEHLSWLVVALLGLWVPPLLFTMGVDLGVITDAASGFPALTDVAVMTSGIQLALMAASLRGLATRRPWAWRLLVAALASWCVHHAWLIQGRIRLTGALSLGSPEMLVALGGITLAAAILFGVRAHFRERRFPAAEGYERVAPGSPAHVP